MPSNILATAGYDHTIRLWDVSNGYCYRTLQFQEVVNKLAISPNKQLLAAGGNPQIKIFELSTNNSQATTILNGHKNNVTALGFQKDGRWMYSGSEDCTVRIWDLRNPGVFKEIAYTEPCTDVSLHPNQRFYLSSYQNGEIRLLDSTNGKAIQSIFPENEVPIHSVDIDANGQYACAVNNKGICFLYEIDADTTLRPLKSWKVHDKYVLKCKFSPNSNMLATISADHTAKIWSIDKIKEAAKDLPLQDKMEFTLSHQKWVWDCAYASNSKYLITVGSDQVAKLWDLSIEPQDGAQVVPIRVYTGHTRSVTCVALHDQD